MLSACGGGAPGTDGQGAAGDLSGSLSATSQAGPQTVPDNAGEGTEEPGAPPESTDFAPVDVDLRDGTFAKGTPKTIHVPSGFIVVITARADDYGTYRLSVLAPSAAQTFKIKPGDQTKVTLDSMREGQSAKLIVDKQTVKIAADADPGP